ncbi:MAG: serine/threonine-protein kinase, partial [Pseudomonadota bacterium]
MSDESRITGAPAAGGAPSNDSGRRGSAAAAKAIEPGDLVLNSYVIVREVARGGMGALFEGKHDITGERVAIKAVLDDFAADARARKLFEKEAIELGKVQHDAIVKYKDILRDDANRLFIIMEFVDGEPMTNFLAGGHLPAEGVELLGARLSAGLAAAHDAGVVHRDIAPKNILLPGGDINAAKIIDFGIAKSLTSGDETLIGDTFAGTIRYAAPEQLGLFSGKVDQRADIYALGITLAHAAGVSLDLGADISTAVSRRQKDVELPADLDPALKRKLERMLRANPEHRPVSMAAAWAEESVLNAASPDLVQDDISEPAPQQSPQPSPAPVPAKRGKGGLIVALVAAAAIIGGGAFAYLGGHIPLEPGPDEVVVDPSATPRQKLDAAAALIAAGGTENLNLASATYQQLSNAGVGEATAALGRMHDPNLFSAAESPFAEPDARKARSLYRRAVRQGYAEAEALGAAL